MGWFSVFYLISATVAVVEHVSQPVSSSVAPSSAQHEALAALHRLVAATEFGSVHTAAFRALPASVQV